MLITDERRHLYRVLDEALLPAGVSQRLAGLGITTLDELRDHWNNGNRHWKYNPLPDPINESQGSPPAGAKKEAKQYNWTTAKAVAAKNVDRLREQLDDNRPVVLSVKTFPSWDFRTTEETGDITLPFPGEASDGGHAICLVGYLLDTTAPGGGRLIFRNSWGKSWATKSQAAAGYGTMPFEYVKKYALEAFA